MVLAQLLETLRLHATVFHNARYCGTWAVDISGKQPSSFHYVVHGECQFRLRSRSEVLKLRTGDLLLLPRNEPHVLGTPDCPLDAVNTSQSSPYSEKELPGSVSLMCGYLECLTPGPHQLLQELPSVVVLSSAAERENVLVESVAQAIRAESSRAPEASSVVINRLAEVLVLHLIREHWMSDDGQKEGLALALADPQVGRALQRIHQELEAPLSLAELSDIAGMSRSSFAERFKRLLGEGPMAYSRNWRLQCAHRCLAVEGISVQEAAFRAGYETETAFSRAFRRYLEPILKTLGHLEQDHRRSELEKCEVVVSFRFPANDKRAESVVPGVGSFDDPTTRPRSALAGLLFLAS